MINISQVLNKEVYINVLRYKNMAFLPDFDMRLRSPSFEFLDKTTVLAAINSTNAVS